eukprot:11801665-Alexandrium_andersonii.AAC.1
MITARACTDARQSSLFRGWLRGPGRDWGESPGEDSVAPRNALPASPPAMMTNDVVRMDSWRTEVHGCASAQLPERFGRFRL